MTPAEHLKTLNSLLNTLMMAQQHISDLAAAFAHAAPDRASAWVSSTACAAEAIEQAVRAASQAAQQLHATTPASAPPPMPNEKESPVALRARLDAVKLRTRLGESLGAAVANWYSPNGRRALLELLEAGHVQAGLMLARIDVEGNTTWGAISTAGRVLWWHAGSPADQQKAEASHDPRA